MNEVGSHMMIDERCAGGQTLKNERLYRVGDETPIGQTV